MICPKCSKKISFNQSRCGKCKEKIDFEAMSDLSQIVYTQSSSTPVAVTPSVPSPQPVSSQPSFIKKWIIIGSAALSVILICVILLCVLPDKNSDVNIAKNTLITDVHSDNMKVNPNVILKFSDQCFNSGEDGRRLDEEYGDNRDKLIDALCEAYNVDMQNGKYSVGFSDEEKSFGSNKYYTLEQRYNDFKIEDRNIAVAMVDDEYYVYGRYNDFHADEKLNDKISELNKVADEQWRNLILADIAANKIEILKVGDGESDKDIAEFEITKVLRPGKTPGDYEPYVSLKVVGFTKDNEFFAYTFTGDINKDGKPEIHPGEEGNIKPVKEIERFAVDVNERYSKLLGDGGVAHIDEDTQSILSGLPLYKAVKGNVIFIVGDSVEKKMEFCIEDTLFIVINKNDIKNLTDTNSGTYIDVMKDLLYARTGCDKSEEIESIYIHKINDVIKLSEKYEDNPFLTVLPMLNSSYGKKDVVTLVCEFADDSADGECIKISGLKTEDLIPVFNVCKTVENEDNYKSFEVDTSGNEENMIQLSKSVKTEPGNYYCLSLDDESSKTYIYCTEKVSYSYELINSEADSNSSDNGTGENDKEHNVENPPRGPGDIHNPENKNL